MYIHKYIGLPWWLIWPRRCNAGDMGFDLWVGKILWRRKWQPIPVFLSGKPHGQRSCLTVVEGIMKSWTGLDDQTTAKQWEPVLLTFPDCT